LLIERNNIIARRKSEEILAEKRAQKRKEEIDELLNWLLGGGIVLTVFGLAIWWLTLLLEKNHV